MNRSLSVVTIGVVSAFFCRQASAWDQPAGARVVVEGSGCDFPGYDYWKFTASDWDECGNRCLGDTYCASFEYNTSSHTCYVKNGIPPIQGTSSEGVCGYIAPRWEWDIDRPGNDIDAFWAATPQACEAACGSNPNCNAWSFNSAKAQGNATSCWLKSGLPDPAERTDGVTYCLALQTFQCGTDRNGVPQYCTICTNEASGHMVSGRNPN
jgi:hypothetical protein